VRECAHVVHACARLPPLLLLLLPPLPPLLMLMLLVNDFRKLRCSLFFAVRTLRACVCAGPWRGARTSHHACRYAGKVAAAQGASTNRYGFRTVTAGRVRLRGSVLLQGAPMVMTSQGLKASVAVGGFKPTARSRIDEIYESLRTVNSLQQRGGLASKELQVRWFARCLFRRPRTQRSAGATHVREKAATRLSACTELLRSW
jgi:hypothetical protein